MGERRRRRAQPCALCLGWGGGGGGSGIFTPYLPGRGFPEVVFPATAGGVLYVLFPRWRPVRRDRPVRTGYARDSRAVVVGGPMEFAPYAPQDVLRYLKPRCDFCLLSPGPEMHFASSAAAYLWVSLGMKYAPEELEPNVMGRSCFRRRSVIVCFAFCVIALR